MVEPRLKSDLRVAAIIRRYDRLGIGVYRRRRGDPDAGAILVKIALGQGLAILLTQTYDREGKAAWMRQGGPEPQPDETVEAAIEKAAARDPDVYVLEVEDREGRILLDAAVL